MGKPPMRRRQRCAGSSSRCLCDGAFAQREYQERQDEVRAFLASAWYACGPADAAIGATWACELLRCLKLVVLTWFLRREVRTLTAEPHLHR